MSIIDSPKMSTQDYIRMEEQYGAHNYHPLDIVIDKAEGAWVYDVEGNKYLDFFEPGDSKHPVFAKVTKGFDVAQKIGTSKTVRDRPRTAEGNGDEGP